MTKTIHLFLFLSIIPFLNTTIAGLASFPYNFLFIARTYIMSSSLIVFTIIFLFCSMLNALSDCPSFEKNT